MYLFSSTITYTQSMPTIKAYKINNLAKQNSLQSDVKRQIMTLKYEYA